ncbi:unnamed protein product [Dibothriocephalus latus]|uniref:Uncharacterized protein n=1 Tax=Dibothriocephalus latus TaxID=60516 RepID=A0A3P6U496_DIBLA|nr:unnamed protein product [Dibothriocephalus latus]
MSQVSSPAFSKFEAKRKKVADKSSSTVKSILKIARGWSYIALLQCLDSQNSTSHLPDEAAQAQKEFNRVLQKWKHSTASDIWRQDASTEQKEELINAIERFLTVWIHPWAFAPRTTDDEEIDLKLQDKIRSLHWVNHVSLEAPIDPSSPGQSLHLESAILG